MMAPAGAAATMAAGTRRNPRGRLAGLKNAVTSDNHSPDRLAGFRMLGQRVVLHALPDLVAVDFCPLFRGDCLVNVSRHVFSILSVLVRKRQQEGFAFLSVAKTMDAMAKSGYGGKAVGLLPPKTSSLNFLDSMNRFRLLCLCSIVITLMADRVSAQTALPETAGTNAVPAAASASAGKREPQVEIEAKFVELPEAGLKALGLPGAALPQDEKAGSQKPILPSVMDADAARELLEKINKCDGADVLSAPRVTTRSAQQAKVEIVREFAYPSAFEEDKKAAGGLRPTAFDKRDIGVTLDVKPSVAADGMIGIDLKAEVVKLLGFNRVKGGQPVPLKKPAATGLDPTAAVPEFEFPKDSPVQPVFSSMSVGTSVDLTSGQTVVLGGLKSDGGSGVRRTFVFVTARTVAAGARQGLPKE